MDRGGAILLFAVSAAFVALGLFLLISGGAEDRLLAWGIIVFFGGCAIVSLAGVIQKTMPPEPDADGVVRLRPAFARTALLLIGGVAFTAGCALIGWIAWRDGEAGTAIIVGASVPFFAGLSIFYAYRAFGAEPYLHLDRDGLSISGLRPLTLRWSDIEAVHRYAIQNQIMLALVLTPEAERKLGSYGRLNAMFGFPRLTLAASQAGVTPDAFEALVLRYWRGEA